jgi:hypothetical protein
MNPGGCSQYRAQFSVSYKRGINMRNSKLFAAVRVATLLSAALLVSALVSIGNAYGDEIVQTAGGVSYVSGGVGTTSMDRLSSLTKDFNLKLVFALKSGNYVSDVKVTIANAAGQNAAGYHVRRAVVLDQVTGGQLSNRRNLRRQSGKTHDRRRHGKTQND